MNWSKIIECVPNFSEGRDLERIDKIVAPFRGKSGVKLLDYSNDEDHNRLVVTLVGEPEALRDAVIEAIGIAVRLIDLNHHSGQHPRMGAVDVVPFIPIKNTTMEEAVALSKEVASRVAELYNLPVFLYEKSATAPHRENLASVRKGEFIRHINGGLRYVKAMGVELKERNITQVSINMTDYTRTALYRAFELVRIEARRYGVAIVGSEIIGLVPMEALIDTASYYLGLENFSMQQVLEARIME